ncbi:MAG TPA: OmpA family protein [Polyangiaceae bacterium]|jgi:outer membrane protein OmpA-like peptidoglycan-associated protein|nr:OmpA family protein [Polyangiaceae bacterium]
MKLGHVIVPVLASLVATACATSSRQASDDRAAHAEADKERAQADARKAQVDAAQARADAQDAARAQYEADQKARFAAQTATQAERDAQVARQTGVIEAQPGDRRVAAAGPSSSVAFAASSAELTVDDKARLRDIADSLRAHPSQRVVVEGYSDGDSGDGKLSQRRADRVAHYLENRGVTSDRIVTRVGTSAAVRYAGTEDINRRDLYRGVEIIVN